SILVGFFRENEMAENDDIMEFASGTSVKAVFRMAIEAAQLKAYETGDKNASVKIREAGEIFEVFSTTTEQSRRDKFNEINRRAAQQSEKMAPAYRAALDGLVAVEDTVVRRGDSAAIEWLAKFAKAVENVGGKDVPYQQVSKTLGDAGYKTAETGDAYF